MTAYVLAENLAILNPDEFAEYRNHVEETIRPFGGRFLVRGGAIHRIEGDWELQRLVIIEFPTLEHLNTWYGSKEYARLKAIRHRVARSRMIAVEGYESRCVPHP